MRFQRLSSFKTRAKVCLLNSSADSIRRGIVSQLETLPFLNLHSGSTHYDAEARRSSAAARALDARHVAAGLDLRHRRVRGRAQHVAEPRHEQAAGVRPGAAGLRQHELAPQVHAAAGDRGRRAVPHGTRAGGSQPVPCAADAPRRAGRRCSAAGGGQTGPGRGDDGGREDARAGAGRDGARPSPRSCGGV
ncbi:hypothetical protein ON010_g17248 [Phytophthora cinnamomi]|nr:hypothetical protein ON010_g17248 [Phytophthora cinnamomi]